MNTSKVLQRVFSLTVVGLVATSAYLAQSGVFALRRGPPQVLQSIGDWDAPAQSVGMRIAAEPSGEAILVRNPFDSARGSLLGEPPGAEVASEEPKQENPLLAPACPELEVSSVIIAEDPAWSSAVVRIAGVPRGSVLRAGAPVGERRLAYIGENPLRGGPTVWFEGAEGLCQSALFGAAPKPPESPKLPPAPPRVEPSPAHASRTDELLSKIQRVGAGEFEIDRGALGAIMENYAQLLRGSRAVPAWRDGTLAGFQLERIQPDTLLGRLGFQSGDQIESINGYPVTSPEKALEAYASLRTASQLRVRVSRGGRATSMEYVIR